MPFENQCAVNLLTFVLRLYIQYIVFEHDSDLYNPALHIVFRGCCHMQAVFSVFFLSCTCVLQSKLDADALYHLM